MNNICIIQVRYNSSRLPGKVLLPLANNKAVIEHVIRRVSKSKLIDKIIIATSTESTDDIIAEKDLQAEIFRGSLDNVFERFLQCGEKFEATNIIRITGDCPCIDAEVIDNVIDLHIKEQNDYTSNAIKRTFPHGLDVEVFNFEKFKMINQQELSKDNLEHVTSYFYTNPDLFKLGSYIQPGNIDTSKIRITLDEPADYEMISIVYKLLGTDFKLSDINQLFKQYPGLSKINGEIIQKHQFQTIDQEIDYGREMADKLELPTVSKILENTKQYKLVVLTEAGTQKGMGHLTRMRSITQLATDATIYLETDLPLQLAENEIKADWNNQSWIEENIDKHCFVVVDSYHISSQCLSQIEYLADYLLVIDDNLRFDYKFKNILNPNLFAQTLNYDQSNQVYCGIDHVLTRKEFVNKSVVKDENVLIMFGGTDVLNLTSTVAEYCLKFNYHINIVGRQLQNFDSSKVSCFQNLDAHAMAKLMQEATVIICAAGQTLNEIVKVQKPAAIIAVVENQINNKNYYIENELMVEFNKDKLDMLDPLFTKPTQQKLQTQLAKIQSSKTGAQTIIKLFEGRKINE